MQLSHAIITKTTIAQILRVIKLSIIILITLLEKM